MAEVNDIFSANPPSETIEVGFNDLVGENQKYKDPDQLAKAYAHLEAHARTLEAENAEARAARDALEAATRSNPTPSAGQEQPNGSDQSQQTPPNQAPQPDNVDFRSQIREEVKALSEQERMAQNMEASAARLVEHFGSPLEANRALQNRARELNVDVDWLRDSAARSPSAFYATMGLAGGQRSTSTPSSGDGIRMNDGASTKNFEYYDKIRKDNPKLYYSANTQREMMNQARTLGGDFYKR